MRGHLDKWLLWTTILLVFFGFIVFFSASLGILARDGQSSFDSVIFSQAFFGLGGGFIFLYITSRIPYEFWKKYSLFLFAFSIILTLLVFVPGIGFSHGGATRWLDLGPFSFQPAEILKLGFVAYFATWASNVKKNIQTFRFGILPLVIMLSITGMILLAQPDTHTLIIITVAAIGMFIVAGAKWKHFFVLIGASLILSTILFFTSSHIHARIMTFFNPGSHLYGAGYQVNQSLIAIGSGGFWGRGLGQSIQKFSFLPEPIGDSIFAVLGEELGFWGGLILIVLFVAFAIRGFFIANRSKDDFGRLLAVGIVIIIVIQAFLNIASMLGIFPLAGVPLTFVSHGGSALLMSLAMVGILLNISKSARLKRR